jgi:hypothetical protein
VLFSLRWTISYPFFFIALANGFFCWVLYFNVMAIADHRSSLSSFIALFITILGAGLNAVTLVFLVFAWNTANVDNQPFNPANDLRYCCVFFGNPANSCPNNVVCNPPVAAADLSVNTDFLIYFWFTVCMLFWHILIIIINSVAKVNGCTLVGRERAAGFDVQGIRYRPPIPIVSQIGTQMGKEQKRTKKIYVYKDPYKHQFGFLNVFRQRRHQKALEKKIAEHTSALRRKKATSNKRKPQLRIINVL